MKEDPDSAARYRQRAEELKVIAETTTDPKSKKTLRDIAEDYERMARSRVRIDESDRAKRR